MSCDTWHPPKLVRKPLRIRSLSWVERSLRILRRNNGRVPRLRGEGRTVSRIDRKLPAEKTPGSHQNHKENRPQRQGQVVLLETARPGSGSGYRDRKNHHCCCQDADYHRHLQQSSYWQWHDQGGFGPAAAIRYRRVKGPDPRTQSSCRMLPARGTSLEVYMMPVIVSGRESGAEESKNQNGNLSYLSVVASDAARACRRYAWR